MGDEDWRLEARCRDLDFDTFFPVGRAGTSEGAEGAERAKAVCRLCDVRAECLGFAIRTNQDFGVWGGMDEEQRRKHRRQLRRRAG